LTVRKPNKSGVVAGLFRPCGSSAPPNSENLLRRPGAQIRILVWPGRMHKAQTLSQPGFLELKKKTTGFGFRFGAFLRIGFPALARDFSGASEQVIY
jgi:hypothetical protein